MSVGLIIAAHKPIAGAFREATLQIMKEVPDFIAVDIDSDASAEALQKQLSEAWDSLEAEERVVILDIEGATPCNVMRGYCETHPCLFLVPLSLPLLFKMICYRSLSLKELEQKAKEIGVTACLIEGKK